MNSSATATSYAFESTQDSSFSSEATSSATQSATSSSQSICSNCLLPVTSNTVLYLKAKGSNLNTVFENLAIASSHSIIPYTPPSTHFPFNVGGTYPYNDETEKLPGHCAAIKFHGRSEYGQHGALRVEHHDHDDWDFGDDEWTIDCYFKFTPSATFSTNGHHTLISKWHSSELSGNEWIIMVNRNEAVVHLTGPDDVCCDYIQPCLNAHGYNDDIAPCFRMVACGVHPSDWNHIALQRINQVSVSSASSSFLKDKLQLYLNGQVREEIQIESSWKFNENSTYHSPILIGSFNWPWGGGPPEFAGWMDHIRIIKGKAAYSGDYSDFGYTPYNCIPCTSSLCSPPPCLTVSSTSVISSYNSSLSSTIYSY